MTTQTGLIGLFGHPVSHSLSPRMHNAAFRSQGLDLVYLAFDVLPAQLCAAVEGLRALGMRGANVTVPHKEAVVPLLDEVDVLAERVGAVNTVVNEHGRLRGHNTDVGGFLAALRSILPSGAAGSECVVLGAGGAARAVMAALVDEGARTIRVHNRTGERALTLCALARRWGPSTCEAIDERQLAGALSAAHVVVNATPVALGDAVKDFPFRVDTLHSGQVVVDLVYGSTTTALVEMARGKGAVAIDGREMLVMQAGEAYRLWTGLQPPVAVMRSSIARGER